MQAVRVSSKASEAHPLDCHANRLNPPTQDIENSPTEGAVQVLESLI